MLIIDAVNSKVRTPITDPYMASLSTFVSSVRKAVKNAFPIKKAPNSTLKGKILNWFCFLVRIYQRGVTHYIPQTLEILKIFAMAQHLNFSVALPHVSSKVIIS